MSLLIEIVNIYGYKLNIELKINKEKNNCKSIKIKIKKIKI